jgi:hypothetical protein
MENLTTFETLMPGFWAWYQSAKDELANVWNEFTAYDRASTNIHTLEDFALEIYSELRGLSPKESEFMVGVPV